MDVLRRELNSIYDAQDLGRQRLDGHILDQCRAKVKACVDISGDCRVITDASADTSWIYGGAFARLIGICGGGAERLECRVDSSDEDIIYNRIHPEDLVDKRMLEYELLRLVDRLPAAEKLDYKATCRFRILNRRGEYIYVENSTRILHLSPGGKIWLILCCYDLSPDTQDTSPGISPRIVNVATGSITGLQFAERRGHILTPRQKEILRMIQAGYPSKQIAGLLGISINTVNRHRQDILQKLSVGNSVEAVMAATSMRLI